jgi:O-antigen ligase
LYWAGRICWIGLWDGANVLSLLFVTAVPFAIEMILGPWKWPARLVAIASMVFIIQGMILAESRGALLALGVVCVLYAVRRIGALGLGVGAIALVGVMAVAPSRMTHLEMDDTSDGQSSKQRVDMWAEGFEMLKNNPVLGIGKGEYAQYTGFLIAHNSFIQNMGETGVVGLFVWLSLIFVSFKGLGAVSRAAPRLSPELVSISRAVNVAFVGYLATSLFITTDFEPLYILMALSAIAYDLARRELGGDLRIEFGLNEIATVGAYEAGGIVVMYLVTRTLSAMM